MLLRSSSAPIPSSLLPHHSRDPFLEPELLLQLPRTSSPASPRQNLAETNHQSPTKAELKRNCIPRSINNFLKCQQSIKIKEGDEVGERVETYKKTRPSIRDLFSSSGLDRQVLDHDGGGGEKQVSRLQTLVMGGGMGSDGGGSGRGSDGGHGSGWEAYGENDHGRNRTDAYYQSMILANPNNALLLGNYAKFLKEVCGDYAKAEEYLERAILANPGDGNALSLYADLIWQTEKNAERAEGYFDQAVKSAPDDCYVLASYAKFLWDAEEEEEEEDRDSQHKTDHSNTDPTDVFKGTHGHHHPHFNAPLQHTSLFLSDSGYLAN